MGAGGWVPSTNNVAAASEQAHPGDSTQSSTHLVLLCVHIHLIEHGVAVKVKVPAGLPQVHLAGSGWRVGGRWQVAYKCMGV